jgi:hypothetical protein
MINWVKDSTPRRLPKPVKESEEELHYAVLWPSSPALVPVLIQISRAAREFNPSPLLASSPRE